MAWTNLNTCKSFTEVFGVTLKALSAVNCSEVIIFNNTSVPLLVYDNNYIGANDMFVVPVSGSMTFRGITNSEQVSAKASSGSGTVSYRAQAFSDNPLNAY